MDTDSEFLLQPAQTEKYRAGFAQQCYEEICFCTALVKKSFV